jgi:hypothetical protein
MKKDIAIPTVEGVYIAVVRKMNEIQQAEWYVYLINENEYALENLLVSSRGYGEIGGETRQTSTLRQAFGVIAPKTQVLIEPIQPEVFPLNNEFWISFYVGETIYDKRYTFVPESIIEDNLIRIEQLNLMGILHE